MQLGVVKNQCHNLSCAEHHCCVIPTDYGYVGYAVTHFNAAASCVKQSLQFHACALCVDTNITQSG